MNQMQEASASAARGAKAQDKKSPFVININDGRLIPNTIKTRANKNYRVYRGDVYASQDERMRYLSSAGLGSGAASVEDDVFELSKATREQLIEYAMSEHGVTLDPQMHLARLRSKVAELAKGIVPDDVKLG